MKRAFALVMIVGLVGATMATAEAGKGRKKPTKIERTAESLYDAPALVPPPPEVGALPRPIAAP